jgi:uncharacterized repeat protein (TIGR01451 family)
MSRKILSRILASLAGLAFVVSGAHAAVGGGATIHNAATLSFAGGQVTAAVQVRVATLPSAPVFSVDQANIDVFASDTANYVYTLHSTSNGSDTYSLAPASADANVTAPTGLGVSSSSIVLGASITSAASDAAGNLFIPAGSESNLVVADRIVINIGGSDYVYEIASLSAGTPASTTGNTTTAETPTRLTLSAVTAGAPAIGAGTVAAGTQFGEQTSVTVSITAGTPAAAGTNGVHTLSLSGTTSAVDSSGSAISYNDGLAATTTVLSSDGNLIKEVRNVTDGGAFASAGVSAYSGELLEYRLTVSGNPGSTLTGAVLEDSIPVFVEYVANSTTMNGNPVADAGTSPFPLDEGGLQINSPSGAAGVIADGETAIVVFRVTVD